MSTYASGTDVSPGRTREEIERTLTRWGASSFGYGWDEKGAMIGFTLQGRTVRFLLPLPDRGDARYRRTETGRPRKTTAAVAAWEQDCRARWRALALIIKAKLAAIEAGVVTYEQEFAMHFVLPGGQTVAEQVLPAIDEAYETGQPPRLLSTGTAQAVEGHS